MPSTPSATPTPITPPRVPLIDQRTGLIDRAWYMFFLSMFSAAQSAEDAQNFGPDTASLAASLEAALDRTTQELETLPISVVEQVQPLLDALAQWLNTLPISDAWDAPLRALTQDLETLPRQELGTFANLQQSNLPWTTFVQTPDFTPPNVGTIAWDGGTTLGVQMTSNVLGRVNESAYVYVKASVAINKGDVCMHTGSVGASGALLAAPATSAGVTTGWDIIGVAAESIAVNAFGLVQANGVLRSVNTSGYADGDTLYWNPAVTGGYTKTKPSAPNVKAIVGEVLNGGSAGGGSILVRLSLGSELGGTDSNVQITSVANKDLLQYDSTAKYWKNVTVPTALSGSGPIAFSSNVGIGMTPNAWVGFLALQVQNGGASLWSDGLQRFFLSSNIWYDGANRKYQTTGPAAEYIQNGGVHAWYTAPSGTAGTNATMTLAAKLNVDNTFLLTVPGGLGYGTGSGGAVTQGTSRTTSVTLNAPNGAITLVSAAGTTTWQSFTINNNTVVATDTVVVSQKSGVDLYQIFVTNVAGGAFNITFATTGGTTTEQPVFNFAVLKAVTA